MKEQHFKYKQANGKHLSETANKTANERLRRTDIVCHTESESRAYLLQTSAQSKRTRLGTVTAIANINTSTVVIKVQNKRNPHLQILLVTDISSKQNSVRKTHTVSRQRWSSMSSKENFVVSPLLSLSLRTHTVQPMITTRRSIMQEQDCQWSSTASKQKAEEIETGRRVQLASIVCEAEDENDYYRSPTPAAGVAVVCLRSVTWWSGRKRAPMCLVPKRHMC